MRRREFITLLGGATVVWPLAARAQQPPTKMVRVGVLADWDWPPIKGLRDGMQELGYVEGQNLRLEYRWSEGQNARYPDLVAELIALNVDVLVPYGTPATLAAMRATTTIPIVMPATADPIGIGAVSNLARPGGNITGFASVTPDLEQKRLELLKELLPHISRVGLLINPQNPGNLIALKRTPLAAKALDLHLEVFEVRGRSDISSVFQALERARSDAILIFADPTMIGNLVQIIEFTAQKRLPAMYPTRVYVDAGGLISYAPDYYDLFRSAAGYVDRILKGTLPGDLPVQQPTKFELVVNLKTAKALGIEVPPSLMLRADEVIE